MEDGVSFLVKDILNKKELKNLDEKFVTEKVKVFLENNRDVRNKLQQLDYSKFRRSQAHEKVIKKIRADLREVYGVFIMEGYNKRFELLEELKKNPSLEHHNKILELHKSSKERLPYYSIVYKKIFDITGKPKKVVDFACGLNPFSYPYLGCKPEYVACELAAKDLEFIENYFKIMNINGSVQQVDLTKDGIDELTKGVDVVFLFKTLDSLEAVKWDISEEVLKNIKAEHIVVSFSTKSLGGKKAIKKEKRAWFERLIKRLNYQVDSFEIPGEIFYVLTRKIH